MHAEVQCQHPIRGRSGERGHKLDGLLPPYNHIYLLFPPTSANDNRYVRKYSVADQVIVDYHCRLLAGSFCHRTPLIKTVKGLCSVVSQACKDERIHKKFFFSSTVNYFGFHHFSGL